MSPHPARPFAPVRFTGQIIEWNAAKGYGFVDDGKQRVFAHIRDFSERPKTPQPGDKVTYSLGADREGRTCAQAIYLPFVGVALRGVHFVVLGVLFIVPGAAVTRLLSRNHAWAVIGWVGLASLVTYGCYVWDKRRAQQGAWRISERFLHFCELLGGWPGAFLAQRRLRHKSAKVSYQGTFWLIVTLHQYVALDAQLGWKLFRLARNWLSSLG